MATAGVAIGLGNVWRFPYMMGEEGGGAFLVIYLLVAALLGVPALMAEWTLGRATGHGPWGAYQRAGLPGAKAVAGLILLSIAMAASYYGVIVAQVLQDATVYAARAVSGDASLGTLAPASAGWTAVFTAVAIATAATTDALGVRKGIERLSKAALPLTALLFLVLLVRVLTLPGAGRGLQQLFVPRPEQLSWSTALKATGQAFFSLALGGMFMVAYGARMQRDTPLVRTALFTAGADVAAALLAAMIVIPAAMALGVALNSGPPLLFQVMPDVFERLPLSDVWGAAFFLAVFLVALLSLIAAYEALAQAAEDALGLRRGRALAVVAIGQAALSIPPIVLGDGYIALNDLIWGTTMQPLGAAVAVVAAFWCMGRGAALRELRRGSRVPAPRLLDWHLRWVTPAAILVILVFGWIERLGS